MNLGLVRVQRETVQDQIYAALREKLMRGAYRPGQKMKLAELAQAFGTSAMPVREALSRLTAERALEALPNRSVRVPTLSREALQDLKEARFAVEGLAVARAALNMTPDALDALGCTIEAQNKTDDDMSAIGSAEQNRTFHFAIYAQSRSVVLLPIIESLWLQFGPYLRAASDHFDGRNGRGVSFHTQILEALARRDADAARTALEADIERAFDIVISDHVLWTELCRASA